MSTFRNLFAIGALAVAASVAFGASAQERRDGGYAAPPGSYRQSCSMITVVGSMLRARCVDRSAREVPAAIDLSTCRNGEIYNDNGALRCTAPAPATLPGGSYRATCRDAVVQGNILTARCATRTGATTMARLDLATCRNRDDVANDNGLLRCAAPIPAPVVLPGGSYRTTCRDAVVQGNILTARCATRTGATTMARLDLATCRNRDEIANDNGILRCAASTQALPSGSYQTSCRDLVLRGNILTARCSRRDQAPVVSSIDVTSCRGRDIANEGGTLRCGYLPGQGRDGEGRGRGRGGRDDFEAVLYTGPNFRGQQLLVTGPIADLATRPGFNDAVRSIRVLRGELQVCADVGFRGRCVTISQSVNDLATLRMERSISSIRADDEGNDGRGRGRGRD